MRFTITKVRKRQYKPFYLGKTTTIPDGFAERRGIPNVKEVELIGSSGNTMNFMINNKEYWIPLSLIIITDRKEKPLFDEEDIFDCDCELCVRKQRLHIKKMNEATE